MAISILRTLAVCLLAAIFSDARATDLTHLGQPASELTTVIQLGVPAGSPEIVLSSNQLRSFSIPRDKLFVITDVDWHMEKTGANYDPVALAGAITLNIVLQLPSSESGNVANIPIFSSTPSPLRIAMKGPGRHPVYSYSAGGHDSLTGGIVLSHQSVMRFRFTGGPLDMAQNIRPASYAVLHGYFMPAPATPVIHGQIPRPGPVTGPGGTVINVRGLPTP